MEPDLGTTSVSSDEEDVHQCGRCKAVFHSITDYFSHKQARSCSRVGSGSRQHMIGTVTTTKEPSSTKESECNPVSGNNQTSHHLTEETEGTESIFKSNSDEDPATKSGYGGVFGRGRRRKAAPKKAWVEDYCLGMEQSQPEQVSNDSNSNRSELTSSIQIPGSSAVTVRGNKARGRPRGSTRGSTNGGPGENFTRMSLRLRKQGQLNFTSSSEVFMKTTGKQSECHGTDSDITPKVEGKVSVGRHVRGRGIRRGSGRGRGRGRGRGHSLMKDNRSLPTMHNCPMCEYMAIHKEEYDRHLRRVHNLSNYVCPNCKRPFRDKYKLRRHLNNKQCKQPGSGSVEIPHYAEFTKKLHTSVPESSKVADSESTERSALSGDVSMQQNPFENQQGTVGKSKNPPAVFGKAVDFSCNECDVVCPTYDAIIDHLKEHPNTFPGICCFCGRWFPSKYKLWRHMTSSIHDAVTDAELQKAKDSICGLKIFWCTSGKTKMRLRIPCNKCSKVFMKKEQLERHIQAVHGSTSLVQRFECDSCGSKFAKRSFLMCHLQKEHGIEDTMVDNFQCPVCMKMFRQKNHVFRHRESLHTAVPQIPSSEVAQLEGGPLPEDEDYIDMDHPKSEKLYTCFVCRNTVTTRSRYYLHLQVHRVWAVQTENGPNPDLVLKIFDNLYNNLPPALAAQLGVIETVQGTGIIGTSNFSEDHSPNTSSVANMSTVQCCTGAPNDPQQMENTTTLVQLPGQQDLQNEQQSLSTPQSTLSTIDQNAFRDLVQEHAVYVSMLQEMESKLAEAQQVRPMPGTLSISQGVHEQSVPGMVPTTNYTSVGDSSSIDMATGAVIDNNALSSTDDQQQILDALTNGQEEDSTENFRQDDNSGEQNPYKSESVLNKPGKSSNDPKDQLCPYCLKLFNSLSELYHHKVAQHSLVAVFVCVQKDCGAIFMKAVDYETHAQKHNQRAFICRVCNQHYHEMLPLIAHKGAAHRTIHNNNSFRCSACGKLFGSREDLTEHVSRDQHHHCSQCNKVYKSLRELKDHLLGHQKIRSFLCDICGSTFTNKLSLNRHRSCHRTERLHKCDSCHKAFAKREHLRRHTITKHSNEKPFVCPHCGKGFKRKDKLQEHFRTHSDAKPYVCHYCGKSYRYREGLRYHEKTHQRELKHFCSMCETGFNRPGALRNHMKQAHSVTLKENSSYPCPHGQCNMCFSRPERVKRHMEREHGVDAHWPFKCAVCNRGFAGEKSLETHVARRHRHPVPFSVPRVRQKPGKARLVKQSDSETESNVTMTAENVPGRPADTSLATTIQLPSGAVATIAMADLMPGAQLQQMLPLSMALQQVSVPTSLAHARPLPPDTITLSALTSQADRLTPNTTALTTANPSGGHITPNTIQTTSSSGYLTLSTDRLPSESGHVTPGSSHMTTGPSHLDPGAGHLNSGHMTAGPMTPVGPLTAVPGHITQSATTLSLGASNSANQTSLLHLANSSSLGQGKNEIPIQIITCPTSETGTAPCTPQAAITQVPSSWAVSPAQLQAYDYFQLNGTL